MFSKRFSKRLRELQKVVRKKFPERVCKRGFQNVSKKVFSKGVVTPHQAARVSKDCPKNVSKKGLQKGPGREGYKSVSQNAHVLKCPSENSTDNVSDMSKGMFFLPESRCSQVKGELLMITARWTYL